MIMINNLRSPKQDYLEEVVKSFKETTRFTEIQYELKVRSGGDYLIIYLSNPTERFFQLLEQSLEKLPDDNPYKERVTIKKRVSRSKDWLKLPETQLLRMVLAESLTVTEHSFPDDFFTRYIKSVSGDEEQIISQGNHIVYGRRGSGKSSLLAYLMHTLRKSNSPYAWVTVQTYSNRKDIATIAEVLIDILTQIKDSTSHSIEFNEILSKLEDITNKADNEGIEYLNRLIPTIRRILARATSQNHIFIFLDDLHVISDSLQPILLDKLYSICRGNQIFLKISGIEQFIKLRDSASRQGLETPGDIQVIRLDYNLTMPDKSKEHIQAILNSHAVYCGLNNIGSICNSGALNRLVWVAAGVPRDALYLFSQAVSESSLKGHKRVSVSSINIAASKMTEEKLRDVKIDASGQYEKVNILLEKIRSFCIQEQRKNVFLIEIMQQDPIFHQIEELIALRLLHILSSGFTPREVGRRYMALMLDYGFYVGIRTAKSIDLFAKEPKPVQARELRDFPVFELSD